MAPKFDIESKNYSFEKDLSLFKRRYPRNNEATEIVLCCPPCDYSASLICRAAEDCDAHVLNLNVTDERTETGNIIVDLRINHRDGENVARSLERYGYECFHAFHAQLEKQYVAMPDCFKDVFTLDEAGNAHPVRDPEEVKQSWERFWSEKG